MELPKPLIFLAAAHGRVARLTSKTRERDNAVLGHRACKERALARAMEIAPLIWRLRAEGRTLAEIATELNWRNVPTPQGRRWYSGGILRLLRRTESEFPALAASAAARPNHRVARARERVERIIPLVWRIALTAKSLSRRTT